MIVQLAAEGRIDLDAPLQPPAGVTAPELPITARMLLQHASGLENYPDVPGYRRDRHYTPAEAVSLSTRRRCASSPARRWYSNANFLWLGLLSRGDRHRLPRAGAQPDRRTGRPRRHLRGPDAQRRVGGVLLRGGHLHRTGPVRLGRRPLRRGPHRARVGRRRGGHRRASTSACRLAAVPCAHDGTHKRFTAIGHTNAVYGGVYHYPLDGATLVVQVEPVPLDVHPVLADVTASVFEALATP